MNKKSLWKLILILAIPCIIGFMPAPAGLSELAWVLFGIYLAAIVGLVIKPFPEPVVLLIAVAASMVVVGNLSDGAFKTTAVLSGYSSGTKENNNEESNVTVTIKCQVIFKDFS